MDSSSTKNVITFEQRARSQSLIHTHTHTHTHTYTHTHTHTVTHTLSSHSLSYYDYTFSARKLVSHHQFQSAYFPVMTLTLIYDGMYFFFKRSMT